MDDNFNVVRKDSCSIIRKVIVDENKVYHLWDSFKDGKKIVAATYKSINPWIEDGKFSYFDQNGKLSASGSYDNGYMTGQWIYYYSNHTDTVDYTTARALLGNLSFSWLNNLNIDSQHSKMSDSQSKYISDHIQFPLRAAEYNTIGSVTVRVHVKGGAKRELRVLSYSHPDNAYESCRILLSAPDSFFFKNGERTRQIFRDFNFVFGIRYVDPGSVNMDSILSDTSRAYVFVDEQATFKGGDINKFRDWVQMNLIYPPEAVMKGEFGRVTLQFAVGTNGHVEQVKLLRTSGSKALDNEALRIANSSPAWVPARKNGKPVRQQFVIPVIFLIR
jgi:TonB family protein